MAEKIARRGSNSHRRKAILCVLAFMVLVNLAVRYPTDQTAPHGSDTFFLLDIARSLTEEGYAAWTLTSMSYFGLYPLSYPSGTPFLYAEFEMLSGVNWNAIPLIFSDFFAVLMVLGGFLLFRTFRIRDEIAAPLAGLLALSPIFLFLTFQQTSGRGFLVPVFILALTVLFWSNPNVKTRILLFVLFVFTIFSIHRSSFVIILLVLAAGTVVYIVPRLPRGHPSLRGAAFILAMAIGVVLLLWPFIPWLDDALSDIPQFSFSFFMAELEFRTGYLWTGDTPLILLGNLSTNYLGSVGLVLLLLPFGIVALYPSSRATRDKDVFMIISLIVFAPLAWKTQYIQLVMLPFLYLLIGIAIMRLDRVSPRVLTAHLRRRLRGWTGMPILAAPRMPRSAKSAALVLFVGACMLFSAFMFNHRTTYDEPGTEVSFLPSENEVALGMYLRDLDSERKLFVSPSGIVDRRIRWVSDWDSPVTDPTSLRSSGYINASADNFFLNTDFDNFVEFLSSFYEFGSYYDPELADEDAVRYDLCTKNIFGFFRLYFINDDESWLTPVSAPGLGVEIVVEFTYLPGQAPNIFMGEGILDSWFLEAVGENAYVIYENHEYRTYALAPPQWA